MVLMDERNHRIGENIRKYRLLKGLTQDELADGLCSVSQLSKVENGKTYLKRSLLKQMADRLGVTIDRIETADAVLDQLSEELQLAKDAQAVENYDKALEVTRQVISKAQEFGYRNLLAESVLLECRLLIIRHDIELAIQKIKEALDNDIPDTPLQKALFLFELGLAQLENGNVIIAYDCFYRADEEFEVIEENDEIKFRVCFSLAKCHSIMNNDRTALRYVEKSEMLATKLSKHIWKIRSKYMKATMLKRLGEPEKAETIFLAALREAEDNDYLLDVAIINNNMGCLFQSLGEYGQAYAHFQRAIQVFQLLGDEVRLAASYLYLAELFYVENKLEKTVDCVNRVFEITNRITVNTYLEKAKAYRILGWVKAKEEWFEEYIAHLSQALQIYDENQVMFEAYDVAKEMAEALYQKSDPRAIEMYRKAVEFNERSLSLGMRR